MAVARRFLIASSLIRLIRKERGSERVLEGYFAAQSERQSHVRIEKGQSYLVLTSLDGSVGSAENWTDVPRSHAEALLEVCAGTVTFERSRLRLTHQEVLVDRFMAPAALDVVSVEFASQDDADAFLVPSWFGAEVTSDDSYTSRVIALSGRPHVAETPLTDAALESLLDVIESGAQERSFDAHDNGDIDNTFDKLRRLAAVRPASALTAVPVNGAETVHEAAPKSEGVARFRNRRPVIQPRPAAEDDGDARLAGVIQGLSEALAQPSVGKNERVGG